MASKTGNVVAGSSEEVPDLPKAGQMVVNAIANLKGKKGSSLAKIKLYLISHFNVDYSHYKFHVNKFVKEALKNGVMTTTGTGLTGYFKVVNPLLIKKYKDGLVEKKQVKRVKKASDSSDEKPKAKPRARATAKSAAEGTETTAAKKTKAKPTDAPKTAKKKVVKTSDESKTKTKAAKTKTPAKSDEAKKAKPAVKVKKVIAETSKPKKTKAKSDKIIAVTKVAKAKKTVKKPAAEPKPE